MVALCVDDELVATAAQLLRPCFSAAAGLHRQVTDMLAGTGVDKRGFTALTALGREKATIERLVSTSSTAHHLFVPPPSLTPLPDLPTSPPSGRRGPTGRAT